MTTFLLIRHATNDVMAKAISGWSPGIHLNEEGREQAAQLAQRLRQVAFAAVFSSPLERTRETADAIASLHGLQVQFCDELGEIRYGEWTGKTWQELESQDQWRLYNQFRSGTRIPGGELMLEAQSRSVVLLDRLARQHPEEILGIVTHGDIVRGLIAYFLGMPLDLFQRLVVAPASVSVLELNPYGPKLVSINYVGPLTLSSKP